MEPSNACLLIWAQRGVQVVSSRDERQIRWMPQILESLGQPIAGGDARPLQCFLINDVTAWSVGSGNQPHRVTETEAGIGRGLLGRAKLLDQFCEFIPIHFHPSAAYEMQATGTREQSGDFRFTQSFAVERDSHLKIEHRFYADV